MLAQGYWQLCYGLIHLAARVAGQGRQASKRFNREGSAQGTPQQGQAFSIISSASHRWQLGCVLAQVGERALMQTRHGRIASPVERRQPALDDDSPYGRVPAFLAKTYELVGDRDNSDLVSWEDNGQRWVELLQAARELF